MSEDEEQDRRGSRETEVEWGARETVDFITKLLVVAGKNVILVVCNRLFKMTHFMATTEGTLAERLVRLFRDNI